MRETHSIQGLDGVLALLQSLPPEVVSKRGGPVLQALRTGAVLIRNEARLNFRRNASTPGLTGKNHSLGFTAKHIISKRGKYKLNGERVVVTVRSKPHINNNKRKGGKPFRTNDAAFIMEYGTVKQPAEPWIRPAFESKKYQSEFLIRDDFLKRLDKIVQRLARR